MAAMKKSLSSIEKVKEFETFQATTNLKIEDIIKPEFLEKIKKNFSDKYELRFSNLNILLLSKDILRKKKKPSTLIPTISVFYNGEIDYNKGIANVMSSDKNILKKFIKQ